MKRNKQNSIIFIRIASTRRQGCISCGTCSYPELTEDHVLTSAYVKIFRIVTRNAVNKSFWRKKDCSWPPLNKYAMNIWLSSLKIRAHLSWRTGKHLHVLHVLRTCSTCSYPGYQDTATYAALRWGIPYIFNNWVVDKERRWSDIHPVKVHICDIKCFISYCHILHRINVCITELQLQHQSFDHKNERRFKNEDSSNGDEMNTFKNCILHLKV